MKTVRPAKTIYHTSDDWWHLLQGDGSVLYLLVNCEASFVSFKCLVQLNEDELRDYHGLGWLSIQHLANRINYFIDDYKSRRITDHVLSLAIEAVR
jgi:hypothetical protein